MASHRKRCTLDTHRAASGIPPTASDAARRIWPLLPAPPRSSRLAFQVRPSASDETPDSPQQAAESPLGSTDAIGCLKQLARIASGAGNSPRRRTARPCESSLGTSSVEQRGAACTWSQASESSKSFLAPAHPDLVLRRRVTRSKAHVLPSARGSSPHAPSSHAQHPSCLHRKAGLAPAEAEMHKKASFREPARQSGCVLMLPIAAGCRVGCRKRHSLESAPTQPV